MNYLKLKVGLVLLLFSGCIHAQQAVLSTGGEAGNSSYSIGQVVFLATAGANGSASLGVQQAFEVFITSGKELRGIQLDFKVFPNPTVNTLILDLGNYPPEDLTYQLFDLQGQLLKQSQLRDQNTRIGLENLPASTYFLKVLSPTQSIKTFKILKNK